MIECDDVHEVVFQPSDYHVVDLKCTTKMEAIYEWCQQWGSVYGYMLSASVRARTIAKLTLDDGALAVAHERSLSTRQLLGPATMEDRTIAYDRVHRLCCKPRIASVSATVIVQHLLDMSLRWWLHWLCRDVNTACRREIFALGATPGSCGVYEHPAWKDCGAIFHDIEVDVAFRTSLRNVLVDIERAVLGISGAPPATITSKHLDSDDSARVVAVVHAVSTLSRHCLFLERVLFVQFLTLNRASEGVVAKILRRAVRDLLERPFRDDNDDDLVSQIKLALVACAKIAVTNQMSPSGASSMANSRHGDQLQQAIQSGKVALIFTLVDASGLSPSLNDTCAAIEAICYNTGAAHAKHVAEVLDQSQCVREGAGTEAAAPDYVVVQLLEKRIALNYHLSLMLQASVTTIFTTRVAGLANERLQACLLHFDCGATDGALADARRIVESVTPAAFQLFVRCAVESNQFASSSAHDAHFAKYCDSFGARKMSSMVQAYPGRYALPVLVKYCESSEQLMSTLQHAVTSSTRAYLESQALVASHVAKGPRSGSDVPASLQVDVILVFDLLTSLRVALAAMVPSQSLQVSQAVLTGVSDFLRAHEDIAVASLVEGIHKLITVDGVRDGSCPADTLESLVYVVSLLPAKDVFISLHGEALGRRLLSLHASGLWTSDCSSGELEAEVIGALSSRIGAATCAPLAAILRDFRSVSVVLSQDSESVAARVMELCMVRWKGLVIPELFRQTDSWKVTEPTHYLEAQLLSMSLSYEASRLFSPQSQQLQVVGTAEGNAASGTPSRRLHWALCTGSVTLNCYYPQAVSGFRDITIQCPPYVALVLDAMAAVTLQCSSSSLSLLQLDDVCSASVLSLSVVRSVVFCLAAVGIIRRSADGTQCGFVTTSIAKHRRMKVNPSLSAGAQGSLFQRTVAGSPSATESALLIERQRKTEACIVRIMKSSKQLTHAVLMTTCAQILSPQFEVTTSNFKVCVAEMISRDYLRRLELPNTNPNGCGDTVSQPGYEYVA